MSERIVNFHRAKSQLLRLVVLVERGARIVITGVGKPVGALRSFGKLKERFKPLDDPLLRADEYSYDGPTGPTANDDIDRTVYGI